MLGSPVALMSNVASPLMRLTGIIEPVAESRTPCHCGNGEALLLCLGRFPAFTACAISISLFAKSIGTLDEISGRGIIELLACDVLARVMVSFHAD